MTDDIRRLADAAEEHRKQPTDGACVGDDDADDSNSFAHVHGACPSCHRYNDIEVEPDVPPDRGLVVECDYCGHPAKLGAFVRQLQRDNGKASRSFRKAKRSRERLEKRERREHKRLEKQERRITVEHAKQRAEQERRDKERMSAAQEAVDRLKHLDERKPHASGCPRCGSLHIGNKEEISGGGQLVSGLGVLFILTLVGIILGLILMACAKSMKKCWSECEDCRYKWN